MEYNKEYVEKNLIAYIGNKRRLLPLITEAIKKSGYDSSRKGKFLDLFAGTGVVSRLAKSLNMEVHTNDWEYYSYIMNKAFIGLDSSILADGFGFIGGIDNALSTLNSITNPDYKDRYISEYYCPQDDSSPDVDNERLFYTKYNGLKIDGIRAKIDEWFLSGSINNEEHDLLLAMLLYEASTRSNTSGVFKGFHRGFGGNNGDALSRIMKEITLVKPELCGGRGFVYNDDAAELVKKLSNERFDIAYLDPPYNQHQYGSNYHLLNTIAKNDKPEINKEFIINGKKINKSAIRKDWIKTRSNFCYKDSAETEFSRMIENINADKILISYSTDGIIPFDNLLDILSAKGKLNIVTSEYEKYRGGKQAITTELKNVEFIIMVDSTERKTSHDMIDVKKNLIMNKLEVVLKKSFSDSKLKNAGYNVQRCGEFVTADKEYSGKEINFILKNTAIIDRDMIFSKITDLDYDTVKEIYDDIEEITSITKEDEVYICLDLIEDYYKCGEFDEIKEVFSKIPYLISKFNNKKAYIPALKALLNVLEVIERTSSYWKDEDILELNTFNKIETILLGKLNFRQSDENETIINLKKQLGIQYDRLYDLFTGKSENKEYKYSSSHSSIFLTV